MNRRELIAAIASAIPGASIGGVQMIEGPKTNKPPMPSPDAAEMDAFIDLVAERVMQKLCPAPSGYVVADATQLRTPDEMRAALLDNVPGNLWFPENGLTGHGFIASDAPVC